MAKPAELSNPKKDPYHIDGVPTKDFFITMLVKDITLRDAIGDLVDNSVDAIKAKAKDPNNLKGYTIEITLGKNNFSISDNGSGLEAEVARNYAFNFGKSPKHILIDKSIGQFGIGMKRAFFKLGSNINIKSTAPTSQFELTIDVSKWQNLKEWEFEIDKGTLLEKKTFSKTGVEIVISNLSNDSKVSFSDKTFIEQLQNEIALEHMLNINKGLKIKINSVLLVSTPITLANESKIKPSYWEQVSKEVSVKVIAGISIKNAEEGGWYIFCNDRLIVAKDKSEKTVWTGSKGDGVPFYHAQYHRFRGYVFFEAKDSSRLPWNTTKTGMDLDSPFYKQVRDKMISMTLGVMDLLDKLKEEKEKGNPEDSQHLNKAIEKSLNKVEPVTEILKTEKNLNLKFHYPIALFNPIKKSKSIKISYQVSREKFEAVSQHLEEINKAEVGIKTFNYFYKNEI